MLAEAGLDVAPKPVRLIRDGLPHPVVMSTWLDGPVSDELPASDGEWDRLVHHYAAIHTVAPAGRHADLPMGVSLAPGSTQPTRTRQQRYLARPHERLARSG